MFERILARVLKDVLGQWVKDFNEKNLKLGAFSGNVQLHNLELRADALDFLQLPVEGLQQSYFT